MSCESKGEVGKNNIAVVKYRRYVIFLIILVIALSALLATKVINDVLKQKRGEDIISSAQREAAQILAQAENESIAIKTSAKEEANLTAEKITKDAEDKANAIIAEAEDKANKIIEEAKKTKIKDIEILLAVTEAEASNQPLEGKAAVAATILNRVESNRFKGNTIREIVYAPGQFNVVSNGKIHRVKPSETTKKAVRLTLEGKDYSNGALYFYNPKLSSRSANRWFSTMKTTTIIGDHVFKR